jgi:hypothetical protein
MDERDFQKIDQSQAAYVYESDIENLSSFIELCNSIAADSTYWFRGQSNASWGLKPPAFRFSKEKKRTQALDTLNEFKRFAPAKLENPPSLERDFEWVQLGRHYELPTRVLDWTENCAVALYFACQNHDEHGLVYLLDPVDLNTRANTDFTRILDPNRDERIIEPYLDLKGRITKRGNYRTVAVNPVWNSDRIVLQKGTFTLHGNRKLNLGAENVSSLVGIPIAKENKKKITSRS